MRVDGDQMRVLAARALAGLVGVGVLLFAAWAVLITALIGGLSARAPDPFAPDGDPCCGHPDTWSDVAWGLAWTLGFVLIDALLASIGIALLSWATRQRWPRLKRLAMLPAGALIAAVLLLALVIVPQLDEGVTPPACDTFAFSRDAWRSAPEHARFDLAYGVAHCDLVDGKTSSQVRRLLGRPTTRARIGGGRTYWGYGDLVVYFADGLVVETHVGATDEQS
jgi:hypothetical protein